MDPNIRKAMQKASGRPQRIRLLGRREGTPAPRAEKSEKTDAVRELVEARVAQGDD